MDGPLLVATKERNLLGRLRSNMDGTHPFDIVEPVSILPPPLVPDLLDLVDLLVPAAIVAAFALAAASAPGPRPASVAHLSKDKICKLPTVETYCK